jgi:hypothetical protein
MCGGFPHYNKEPDSRERGKGLGRSKVEEERWKSETKNKAATWWPHVALSDLLPYLSSS